MWVDLKIRPHKVSTNVYQNQFITGRPARSAAMPVLQCILFLLSGPKWVFRPAGATRCPDKREIWHGPLPRAKLLYSRCDLIRCLYSVTNAAAPMSLKFLFIYGPLPRAKFHVYRGRNVGIQPPKLSNFEFWP